MQPFLFIDANTHTHSYRSPSAMGNKGQARKAGPLANFSNASPPLPTPAASGQATGHGTKTAPVLPAAPLPGIPALVEASSKALAPGNGLLSPCWRDGTPAFIPPPPAKVGSSAPFAPPAAAQAAAAQRAGRGGGGDGEEYNPSANPPPRPPTEDGGDDEAHAEEEGRDGEGGAGGRGRKHGSGPYSHWRPKDDLRLVQFGTSSRVLTHLISSCMRVAWVSMSFPSPPLHTANSRKMAGRIGEKNIDAEWQVITNLLKGSRDVSLGELDIKQVKYRFTKLVKAALAGEEGSLRKSGSQDPEPELQGEIATAVQHYIEGKYHFVERDPLCLPPTQPPTVPSYLPPSPPFPHSLPHTVREKREIKSRLDQVMVDNGRRLQDASQSMVGRAIARSRGARGAHDRRSKRRRRQDMYLKDDVEGREGRGGGQCEEDEENEDDEYEEEEEEGDRQPRKRKSWGQAATAAMQASDQKVKGLMDFIRENNIERKERGEKVFEFMLRLDKREKEREKREEEREKREKEREKREEEREKRRKNTRGEKKKRKKKQEGMN